MIQNPILRGFNPDPSILRVGDDYYIAASTFEWFPGVRIYHSKDLVHWEIAARPLDRISMLDMRGVPDSGGVWAPCLSYADGLFYLIYTNVRSLAGAFKDTPNYLVTASDIRGEWSEPVYLNSSGFDPSLFHDDDGRKWLLNMVWDHRQGRNAFAGIVIQEYSIAEKKLIGPIRTIFNGTELGVTEGPHLYKKDGYYYLMTAEGGTGYEHAVTMARSRDLFGPYEVDPENPILTSRDKPELALQKSGHGSLVETASGEWYLAHLCARPLDGTPYCVTGRETALQPCEWTADGWLRLSAGGSSPQVEVQAPALPAECSPAHESKDDFDGEALSLEYSTLRIPATEDWLSLKARPGYLRLYGRESMNAKHEQSLVARPVQSTHCTVETAVEFKPDSFQQMAGLICYYNTRNYYYLRVSLDEERGAVLGILSSEEGKYSEPLEREVSVEGWDRVHMRVVMAGAALQYFYSRDGLDWLEIGPKLDSSLLSDERAVVFRDGYFAEWGFTGAFIGVCVQDLAGRRNYADFDYVDYQWY